MEEKQVNYKISRGKIPGNGGHGAKIMLPVLSLVIALSALSLSFAWFNNNVNTSSNTISVSSKHAASLLFSDFERDTLDSGVYSGETGLGFTGTESEGDAPYEARFFITLAISDSTPVPLEIIYRIESVTIDKSTEEPFSLSKGQIEANFKIISLNPLSLEEDYILNEQDKSEDYILVIRYWGGIPGVAFEFCGIEYNGAQFAFSVNVYGGNVIQ